MDINMSGSNKKRNFKIIDNNHKMSYVSENVPTVI